MCEVNKFGLYNIFHLDFILEIYKKLFTALFFIIKIGAMHTNGICQHCGKKIRFWITLCSECRNEKRYHAAVVSVNKKRMAKTLKQRKLDRERLDKIWTQSNNILEHWECVLEIANKN